MTVKKAANPLSLGASSVTVAQGDVYKLEVNYTGNNAIRCVPQDSSIVRCTLGSEWYGGTRAYLEITGVNTGSTTVTLTDKGTGDSVKCKVTVVKRFSMDKTSVNYLATTLENWYSQDITTYDQVEAEIVKRTELYSYEKIVCKCFGISGRLSSSQREYAEKWRSGGIDESLLGIAYDKCMDGTGGKLRFKYIDTVISSWMNKGIKTAEQVKADDEQFRGKNSASSAASEKTNSYSIEKLEEMDKNFVLRNEENKQ